MNQVTQVNILNGDVKFTYEDGSQRTLLPDGVDRFKEEVDQSRSIPIDFATPQRRLVYVANRFFN